MGIFSITYGDKTYSITVISQITVSRTPVEVHTMLDFLTEIQEVIKSHYAAELDEFYREIYVEKRHEHFGIEDDQIPF